MGEDTAAGDALRAEPAHSPDQEADLVAFCSSGSTSTYARRGRHPPRHGARAPGTALTTDAGNPVADSLEPGQPLGVDVDHVAWLLPLVPLHWNLGLQVPQAAESESLHHPSHSRQGSTKGPGDPPEAAALVPEVQGVLQLLRIERPRLGMANTPSICQ